MTADVNAARNLLAEAFASWPVVTTGTCAWMREMMPGRNSGAVLASGSAKRATESNLY